MLSIPSCSQRLTEHLIPTLPSQRTTLLQKSEAMVSTDQVTFRRALDMWELR